MKRGLFLIIVTIVIGVTTKALAQTKDVIQLIELAERGSSTAQLVLANKYEKGIGIEKDLVKAESWYKRAISNGSNISNVYLAALKEKCNNKAEAYKYFMQYYLDVTNAIKGKGKVDKFDANSFTLCQYKIGEYKLYGFDGVSKDVQGAIPYLKDAALNSYGESAYFNLCTAYLELGDSLDAFNIAEQCTEKYKSTRAYVNLAGYYMNGIGCDKDLNKAYDLILPLAEKKDATVLLTLGNLHSKSEFKLFNYSLAFKRYSEMLVLCETSMLSDSRNAKYYTALKATALRKLSKCYRFGRGVNQDTQKAEELLNEAAQYGNEDAKSLLDLIMDN